MTQLSGLCLHFSVYCLKDSERENGVVLYSYEEDMYLYLSNVIYLTDYYIINVCTVNISR